MTMHFHREIEKLKKMILSLGTIVEETLQKAIKALEDKDTELAKNIIKNDNIIDGKEVEVEEECLKILALYQPVASDLRYIVSVLKINNDLERVGDIAVHIAERTLSIAASSVSHILITKINFNRMVDIVVEMLRKSLDALINLDTHLARKICKMDDEIDSLHESMFKKIEELIIKQPKYTSLFMQHLSVSRYLERIADLTTNIAEDVIYLVEGEIARHNKKILSLK
jgi:phosphate transport system protein